MKYDYIIQKARKLKRKYGIKDLKELCKKLQIVLNEVPMGTSDNAVKGLFIRSARVKVITINSQLPETVRRIILAHEMGHAVLHGNGTVRMFRDQALYDESSIAEKEANLFAAELLMEDREVISCFDEGVDFFAAASIFNVPGEFLEFKLRLMREKGIRVPEAPITAPSKFLKNIQIPENHDDDYA